MKKLIVAIFLLFLFIGVSFANTEFIQAPYSFQKWISDLQKSTTLPITINLYEIRVGTFVCLSSFTATTGNFLENLWVKGVAVLTDATISGKVHGTTFQFDNSYGDFFADNFNWRPISSDTVNGVNFNYYDSSGTMRALMYPVFNPATNDYYWFFKNQGIQPNDAILFETNYFGFGKNRASNFDAFDVFYASGDVVWHNWTGSTHTYHKGLNLAIPIHGTTGYFTVLNIAGVDFSSNNFVSKSGDHMTGDLIVDTTVEAHTGNFDEVLTSTIIGKSPVNIPTGIRFSDGSVLTSTAGTGGFTSSSTARIPTVYVCASNAPDKLKAIADYVCIGSSDEITITQALDSITKGTIRLSGNFNVSAPVYINKDSITICGEDNWGTKIKITDYATFGSYDGIFQTTMSVKCLIIKDIWFEGGKKITKSGVAFSNEDTLDTLGVYNCYLSNMRGSGIFSDTSKTIKNVWIENNFFNEFGSFVVWFADNASYIIVKNNYFYENTVGIGFLRLSDASKFTVSDNYMYNSNAGAGINTTGVEFDSCSYGRITHNTFDHSGNFDTSGDNSYITIEDNTFLSCGASSAFYGSAIGYYGGADSYINIINNKISGSVNYDGIFFYTTGGNNIISGNIVADRVGGNVGIHTGSLQPIIVSNNICNGNSFGFNISSTAIITENHSSSAIADAIIAITSGKDNNNSWNTNNITAGGEVPMSASLDMGNNSINNCPVIFNTTTTVQVIISTNAQQQNEIYDLQKSTGGLQFAIGIDSVPAVNDFCGTSTLFNWNLKSLYGFLDTPATGSAFIADCYISNSADVVATIKIDIGCSSTTVVNISSQVPSGYWFKARIKQIGSTVSGSDFRINGEYTK